jgi:hypothetical protein
MTGSYALQHRSIRHLRHIPRRFCGKVTWSLMNLRYYAYLAYLLLILSQLPGRPSQATGPFAEESQVTAARQHTLKISFQLLMPARIVRGDEP